MRVSSLILPSLCYKVRTFRNVVRILINFWGAVYAAISSASLSLVATGVDSIFDVGSNFLLYYINYKASRMDVNKWPVGGARLETIGNVIYGMTYLPILWSSLTSLQVFCANVNPFCALRRS